MSCHPEVPYWPRKEPDEVQWQRELRFAERVQALMSGMKSVQAPGAEAAGCSIPHFAVGGDYFDILALPDGGLRVVVADVMGKGFGAAMIMTMVRSAVRSATHAAMAPGALLKHINDMLYEDLQQVGAFVTVSCTDYQPASRTITAAGAGHPYPWLIRADQPIMRVEARGVSIGMLPNRRYQEQVVPVEPGDRLIVYSDGIVEAREADGKELGTSGLESLVRAVAGHSGREWLVATLSSAAARVREVRDDVTLAVVDFGDDKSVCPWARGDTNGDFSRPTGPGE